MPPASTPDPAPNLNSSKSFTKHYGPREGEGLKEGYVISSLIGEAEGTGWCPEVNACSILGHQKVPGL